MNFVDWESFLESNSPEILALCESNSPLTNLDDSTFSVIGYLPLIGKGPSIHMHDLAVYVKEGLHFAWEWDLSPENSADSYLCSQLVFIQCLTSFSSINHLCLCVWFLILFHLT